ncbi:hypothetical protein VTN02DRAFT_4348 [Thermoascus thermophilus]
MLGGAVNPVNAVNPATSSSEAAFRTASRPASQASQASQWETASARSASTPTSSAVPPSTSAAASTNRPPRPPHHVPAYLQHPQSSARASALPASGHHRPSSSSSSSSSMTSHVVRAPSSHDQSAHTPHHRHPQHPADARKTRPPLAQGPGPDIPPAWPSASPSSPRLLPTYRSSRSLGGSEASSPSRIKVRDLSHIQSFASEEFLAQSQRARGPGQEAGRHYEISSMPVTDIIEMVAGLLTKITTTNDRQHDHVHRHIPPPEGTAGLSPQATSVLAFHGKNVPSITILSYLSRIHKYCPTTYEVFLSLLVYFDRMTEMVNRGHLQRLRRRATVPSQPPERGEPPSLSDPLPDDEDSLSHFFVVDSFNIHRLVIAGVTCASKFFSDVFYTNSRYAKVGGLPLVELNHLELQFLLLNDFRLSIPVEELEAYGTMLVEFYAREIVAQQQKQQQQQQQQQAATAATSPHESTAQGSPTEGVYMRSSRGNQSGSAVHQTPTPP